MAMRVGRILQLINLRLILASSISAQGTCKGCQLRMWRPQPVRFAHNAGKYMRRSTTPFQSMKEFFLHPLTWEHNNGYFNLVLLLALLSLCFVSTCGSCPQDTQKRMKRSQDH